MCDSQFHMDAFWDEKLNDIDEFIQSELGSVEPEGRTILNLQTLNLKDDQASNPGMSAWCALCLKLTNCFLLKKLWRVDF